MFFLGAGFLAVVFFLGAVDAGFAGAETPSSSASSVTARAWSSEPGLTPRALSYSSLNPENIPFVAAICLPVAYAPLFTTSPVFLAASLTTGFALSTVVCHPVKCTGAGRTDAGVHALGFMLNFHADTRIPAAKLPLALNQHLPPDIRALEARVVPDDFHARYAAHTKTYLYRIHNSQIDSPFAARYYTKVPGRLDADRMQQAAQYFVGKHDFLALCASGSSAAAHGDTVRTITACDVQRRGDDIDITVTADGYLYNMVRILAGTLCEAGAGRLAPEAVPGILASRDRKNAGPTLAAKGLFLKSVDYDTPIE